MPGPPPKDPGTRQRQNKASTRAVLSVVVDHGVPPLPPAGDWLGCPSSDESKSEAVQWPKAVEVWWETIWTSPMSNEFHESDMPQLYLGAFYLAQVVDPWLKTTERLAAGKQHEAMVKNFGLNPMSRRSLQWEIEKVGEAQHRSAFRNPTPPADGPVPAPTHQPDPRQAVDEDEDNPFTVARKEKEKDRERERKSRRSAV